MGRRRCARTPGGTGGDGLPTLRPPPGGSLLDVLPANRPQRQLVALRPHVLDRRASVSVTREQPCGAGLRPPCARRRPSARAVQISTCVSLEHAKEVAWWWIAGHANDDMHVVGHHRARGEEPASELGLRPHGGEHRLSGRSIESERRAAHSLTCGLRERRGPARRPIHRYGDALSGDVGNADCRAARIPREALPVRRPGQEPPAVHGARLAHPPTRVAGEFAGNDTECCRSGCDPPSRVRTDAIAPGASSDEPAWRRAWRRRLVSRPLDGRRRRLVYSAASAACQPAAPRRRSCVRPHHAPGLYSRP